MELLDSKMKKEMEECKRRARAAGLQFQDNTLEYVVTNQDMLELMPRNMIPTLYDYWVHNIGAVRNKWIYDIFPHNPYETVINTRPAISFYNADNADWLNVMIFYHVLGHIDFFQNNIFFRKTWDDDFCGQALADKRLINKIREELGVEKRWVDYVIEFSRAINNLVGYYQELEESSRQEMPEIFRGVSEKVDFYFGEFLRDKYEAKTIDLKFYHDEIGRFNRQGETAFFLDISFISKFPEFHNVFRKWKEKEKKPKPEDIFQHLTQNSEFLNKEQNKWMRDVMQVIRRTSLYFQPQIRTKIANEGWASLWHEKLFIPDERIKTHEIGFAKVDSSVVVDPRIGFNPYAAGKHLFEFIEDLASKGRLSPEYRLLKDMEARKRYDRNLGQTYGKQVLFGARKYLNDHLLINFLSDDDFQDFVDRYKLFVYGIRPHRERWDRAEVYIKSRSGKDYRKLLNKFLYHPPHIIIAEEKTKDGELYLDHVYEGRTLFTKHIPAVLIGLEFLWGKRVRLETTEYEEAKHQNWWEWQMGGFKPEHKKIRVVYTCEKKKVERKVL